MTTPTVEHGEDSVKLSDLAPHSDEKRNTIVKKPSFSSHHNLQTINGSLSRLSPDLLSDGDDGGNNDADSIISLDSIKSNTAASKLMSITL